MSHTVHSPSHTHHGAAGERIEHVEEHKAGESHRRVPRGDDPVFHLEGRGKGRGHQGEGSMIQQVYNVD